MIVGTVSASSTGTISLTYLPSIIHFDIGTVPTSLKVTVLGDGVICDLDGAGIAAASRRMRVGNLADQYVIQLADGLVRGKNVEIEIANAHAGTLTVYGYSEATGSTYIRSMQQQALANSGIVLKDFTEVALPSMAAADELNIQFGTGKFSVTQKMALEDLKIESSFSTYTGDDVSDIRIQNENARIHSVNFIPDSTQQVYMFRFVPIGNF